MIEAASYTAAFIFGVVTALFYYAGLWYTVKWIDSVSRPYVLLLLSIFTRLSFCFGAFYIAVNLGGPVHLLLCAGGFFIFRMTVIRHVKARGLQRPDTIARRTR